MELTFAGVPLDVDIRARGAQLVLEGFLVGGERDPVAGSEAILIELEESLLRRLLPAPDARRAVGMPDQDGGKP